MNVHINYDAKMRQITENLSYRPRLLLHSCCGPCSTACLERLMPHFEVTVFFCNPNIMPDDEYYKRLESLRAVCDFFGVELMEEDYGNAEFLSLVKGMENMPEGGERCKACFELRLSKTAREAKRGGFEYFSTTLTVSPHKNSTVINAVGLQIQQKTGIKFLPSDFKKQEGYKRSIELSRQLGLYRQSYCGCKL